MRPLTKSRFKLALDCPTKLYYTNKTSYPDKSANDAFMDALAEGGFQVGELAKYYYPGGHDITESGYEAPLKRTNELLKQENVVIYEAALLFENYFIRVDVLEKIGNRINLIEVKAKSFSGNTDEFLDKKGKVNKTWDPYIQDVTFQKFVTEKAFPHGKVTAYLMLADKSAKASVNGLNQMFQIVNVKGRKSVKVVDGISHADLGNPILKSVNVDEIAKDILREESDTGQTYEEKVSYWSDMYAKDERMESPVGIHCLSCEFHTDESKKRSGFRECWSKHYSWTEDEYAKPKTTAIWDFKRKSKLFEEGVIFADQLQQHDIANVIEPKPNGSLSRIERQWMQVEKIQNNDSSFYLDRDGMKAEMDTFTYPLHFIDFETSTVAIPFFEGQHPYEQVAFQFSHHIMREDGSVEHIGEFIEVKKGAFPNFNFVRALKNELDKDEGTIFKFAAHENTVLNQVEAQMREATEEDVPDKEELLAFMESITHNNKTKRLGGPRDMVDMCQMVKDYYFDPLTGGSNSIKAVLPAALNRSNFVKSKYAQPIYGKTSPVKSLNYPDGWIWINEDENGSVINPYKILPSLFEGVPEEEKARFITHENLADGGAALAAFAKMQFSNISDVEREKIIAGLLKYCELDTLAMVMIYEFWLDEVSSRG